MRGLVAECRICRKEFALELIRYGPGESPGPSNNPLKYRERLRNPDGSLHDCQTFRDKEGQVTKPPVQAKKTKEPKAKPHRTRPVWEQSLE